jgi:hypothetical protein
MVTSQFLKKYDISKLSLAVVLFVSLIVIWLFAVLLIDKVHDGMLKKECQ